MDTGPKSATLDWGSAGEWRCLSGSAEQDIDEMNSDLNNEAGAHSAEHLRDGQLASSPTMAETVPTASGLIGDEESNLSDSEQLSSHGDSEEVIGDGHTHDIPVSCGLTEEISKQHNIQGAASLKTDLFGVEFSPSPCEKSYKTKELLPPATIRGPFLNIASRDLSVIDHSHSTAIDGFDDSLRPATTDELSSQYAIAAKKLLPEIHSAPTKTILRGLIRDSHHHMLYFTLAHSEFLLDDLRHGLDYAYSMHQAATSKLAILRVLRDDAIDMSNVELRRWITHVENMDDPLSCCEPRMSVVFESVSADEMKLLIAELIQARRTVEDEVKQMRALLIERAAPGAESVHGKTSSDDGSICDGEAAETIMLTGEVPDAYDDSWEAFATVTILVTLGLLYLCVRE